MSTTFERNLTLRSHFGADRHSTLSLPILYFALFAGDPAGIGVEPDSTGGYARVAKDNDATLWGTIGSSIVTITNSASGIVWPVATGAYSVGTDELTHWGIFDNSAGGNLRYFGELTDHILVSGAGDQPRIPVSTLIYSTAA